MTYPLPKYLKDTKTHPRSSLAVYEAYRPKRIFFRVIAPSEAKLSPLQTYDLCYGPKDEEFYRKHLTGDV